MNMSLSDHLGVTEYVLNAPSPFKKVFSDGVELSERTENGITISTIRTRLGELEQRVNHGFIVKPYVTAPEDLVVFLEFVKSWRYELLPEEISEIRRMKTLVGENGILWNFGSGTPLGMMYRVYSDIKSIVYMMADIPERMRELFDIMEDQYQREITLILESTPEIDVFVGIDDTSTTLVSPSMFAECNSKLTDRRADIAADHDRYYMHHSCGLLRDLLPVYGKTRMHGVHAFCRPPIGNVTYREGRKLLGDKISIAGNMQVGLHFPDKETQARFARDACEDAKAAGCVMFYITTPNSYHSIDFMRIGFEEAWKHLKY